MGRMVALVLLVFIMTLVISVPVSAAPVRIKVYSYLDNKSATALPDLVKAKYPNLELEIVRPGPLNDFQKVMVDVLVGEYDLMVVGGVENIPVNFLRPLDGYIARDRFDLQPYGNWVDKMKENGRLYDLPLTTTPFVTAINLEMLESAGLERPASTWSWQDFRRISQRLNSVNPTQRRYGALLDRDTLSAMLNLAGTETLGATDQLVTDAITSLYGMAIEDKSAFLDVFDAITPRSTFLAERKAAMQVTYLNVALTMASDKAKQMQLPPITRLGILPIPRQGKSQYTNSICTSVAIPAVSKHPDEAWQVASILASLDGARLMAGNGYLPALRTPEIASIWARAKNLSLSAADYAALSSIQPFSATRKYERFEFEFTQRLREILVGIFKGQLSKQAAIDAIMKQRDDLRMLSGVVDLRPNPDREYFYFPPA